MKLFKNKKSIFIILITISFFLAIKFNIINLEILVNKESVSVHFNLITVNSVFAGFLFSSLTLLVGLNATKTIVTLERIGHMENIYKNITSGLVSSLVSIILSLTSIFILPFIKGNSHLMNIYIIKLIVGVLIPGFVLLFIIYTIVSFLIATNDIKLIISSIRRKSFNSAPSKESIQKTLDSIK